MIIRVRGTLPLVEKKRGEGTLNLEGDKKTIEGPLGGGMRVRRVAMKQNKKIKTIEDRECSSLPNQMISVLIFGFL